VYAWQQKPIFSFLADSLFNIAVSEYLNGEPDEAYTYLDRILRLTRNQRTTASFYMITRIISEKGELHNTVKFADEFLKLFPDSKYGSDIRIIKAKAYFDKNVQFLALRELLDIVEAYDSIEIKEKGATRIVNLFDTEIPDYIYTEYKNLYSDPLILNLLDLKRAQLAVYKGEFESGLELLEIVESGEVMPAMRNSIIELHSYIENEFYGYDSIALLMPFTGEFEEKALKLHKGARFALDKYNRTSERELKLKPLDTGGDFGKISGALNAIAEDRTIFGAIGPIDPQLQALASTIAAGKGTPLILPDNCRNNFLEENENVFKMLTSGQSEGETLAKYAFNELGYKTFAILSPLSGVEEQIANGFALEIERLGGEILVHEWFYPGAIDFHQQFMRFRKIGMGLMRADSLRLFIRDMIFDSTTTGLDSMSIEQLDSLNTTFMDSLTIVELDSFRTVFLDSMETRLKSRGVRELDSLNIPIYTFDAIFMPVTSSEDLDYIANQFAFYNFRSNILGNSAWHDNVMLDRVQRTFRFSDVHFTSDYLIDETYIPWIDFVNEFRMEMGYSPGVEELYGFDAMSFALNSINSGARSRKQFLEQLLKQKKLAGSGRGDILFNEKGQKSNSLILNYYRGLIQVVNATADTLRN
jgi:ABC-type branched-subunit amino acid transport system substrate-binding protein